MDLLRPRDHTRTTPKVLLRITATDLLHQDTKRAPLRRHPRDRTDPIRILMWWNDIRLIRRSRPV